MLCSVLVNIDQQKKVMNNFWKYFILKKWRAFFLVLLLLFYRRWEPGPVFKFIVRMAGVFAGRVDPVHTVAQYLAVLATEADVAVRVEPGDVGGEVLHVHRPVLTVWTFIINTLLSWK